MYDIFDLDFSSAAFDVYAYAIQDNTQTIPIPNNPLCLQLS